MIGREGAAGGLLLFVLAFGPTGVLTSLAAHSAERPGLVAHSSATLLFLRGTGPLGMSTAPAAEPAGVVVASEEWTPKAPRVSELDQPLRQEELAEPCALRQLGQSPFRLEAPSTSRTDPLGSHLRLVSEARVSAGRLAVLEGTPLELSFELLGDWVLRSVAGGVPGTALVQYSPGTTVRISVGGVLVGVVAARNLTGPVHLALPGIGDVTVGEVPHAVGLASAPPTEATDGTVASGALDIIRLRLVPGLSASGLPVELRIGHLEVSAQVSEGGISCLSPNPTSGRSGPEQTAQAGIGPTPLPSPRDEPQRHRPAGDPAAVPPSPGPDLATTTPLATRPTVTAANTRGTGFGPPGSRLLVSASGYGGCRQVNVYFDKRRIGTVRPDGSGRIDHLEFTVPAAGSGLHTVRTSCGTAIATEASSPFRVTAPRVHRAALVATLPEPAQLATDIPCIGRSALIALAGLLLIAFPGQLFNSTLNEHYGEVRSWFGLPARPERAAGRRGLGPLVGFVLCGGLLDALLDPHLGLDLSSAVLVAALVVSLVIATLVFGLPALAYYRRRGAGGGLVVLPGTLLVAAACVVGSRLVRFQPGYLYGVLAGFEPQGEDTQGAPGALTAVSCVLVLAIGLLAWLARSLVSGSAARPDPSLAAIFLDAVLATTFQVGLETAAIGLLPLRFLEGEKVLSWNRACWAALFALSAFAFVHILLSPTSGYVGTSPAGRGLVVALFAGFGVGSLAFWAYFRFYRPVTTRSVG